MSFARVFDICNCIAEMSVCVRASTWLTGGGRSGRLFCFVGGVGGWGQLVEGLDGAVAKSGKDGGQIFANRQADPAAYLRRCLGRRSGVELLARCSWCPLRDSYRKHLVPPHIQGKAEAGSICGNNRTIRFSYLLGRVDVHRVRSTVAAR